MTKMGNIFIKKYKIDVNFNYNKIISMKYFLNNNYDKVMFKNVILN